MNTPLSSWHRAHGATLINDRGIELPERFSVPQQEYQAVRERAGLLDLSFRAQVCMTGEDRVSFLQGMISNDVKGLQPGSGCPATLLTEQGRIVADLRVYAVDTALLLDVDTRVKDKMIEALSRFIIADDVEMEDLGERQVVIALQGPLASQIFTAAGVSLALDKSFQHQEVMLAGAAVRVIRISDTGEEGYEIYTPIEHAEQCWSALHQAGEPLGLQPVGLAALQMLRIEAGIPWYGLDMDEGRIVLEVGLDQAISFKKGCYLGQEVVERASARGHVNRKLSGLHIHGNTVPAVGSKLYYETQDVGWITSTVASPRFGHPIALGYVRREHLTPGTPLRIDSHGTAMIAEVATLPFSR